HATVDRRRAVAERAGRALRTASPTSTPKGAGGDADMRRAGWIAAGARAAARALALTGAGTASAAETVYGLTAADKLVTFSSDRPGSTSTPLAVTGLLAGEPLVGAERAPAAGQR